MPIFTTKTMIRMSRTKIATTLRASSYGGGNPVQPARTLSGIAGNGHSILTRPPSTTSVAIQPHHQSSRGFSDDSSHSDFAPQRKPVPDAQNEAVKMVDEHVKANPIMLYMKGKPSMPMCGFSAQVVQVLQQNNVDFASVNVLDYPAIRDGVKAYSQWPTIPQLYVKGEFIGGCDIVTDMHASGELKQLLTEFMRPPEEKK